MPERSHRVTPAVLITLGMLAPAPPLSTDLYLSAFPVMAADLDTTATGIQLSLTTFLIGAGVGQMVFGPWSDRSGRMIPLLSGLLVYVVSSVIAAIAPSVTVLIIARGLQGIGIAAGMVIGRAIVLDLQSGTDAARALNVRIATTVLAPIVAALVGRALDDLLGCRRILWVVFGLARVSLHAAVAVLREGLPREERQRRRSAREPGAWRGLLALPYVGSTLT